MPHPHPLMATTSSVRTRGHLRLVDARSVEIVPDEPRLIALAREISALLPAPSGNLASDEPAGQAFAMLVDEVVEWLIVAAEHDLQRLMATIGSPIEVGVNPPWRVLLELAADRLARRPRPVVELAPAVPLSRLCEGCGLGDPLLLAGLC